MCQPPASTGKLSLWQLLIFFSLSWWDPNTSLWPSGPCLIMVDTSRACLVIPQAEPSCPLAAAPLTHIPPGRALSAAGGGEPNAAFSQLSPLTVMFGFSDLISWYVPRWSCSLFYGRLSSYLSTRRLLRSSVINSSVSLETKLLAEDLFIPQGFYIWT